MMFSWPVSVTFMACSRGFSSVLALASTLAALAVTGASASSGAAQTSAAVYKGRLSGACAPAFAQLAPGAEGEALEIRVTNIGCRAAVPVIRNCLRSKVAHDWHAHARTYEEKPTPRYQGGREILVTTLTSAKRSITFQIAGGGGCVSLG